MEIRIRNIDGGNSKHFTRCKFSELDGLIRFIGMSGGVLIEGETVPFHSYQLVYDEGGAYAEILLGEEE